MVDRVRLATKISSSHWIADEGWAVPATYREVFEQLARRGIIPTQMALRLAAGAGLRNLVAHRYGELDWRRLHEVARNDLDVLDDYCAALASCATP